MDQGNQEEGGRLWDGHCVLCVPPGCKVQERYWFDAWGSITLPEVKARVEQLQTRVPKAADPNDNEAVCEWDVDNLW